MTSNHVRDPGDPRGATSDGDSPDLDELVRSLGALLRGFCLIAFFIVLVIGAYYAIHVFGRIGKLIADPTVAQSSVDAIAEMIDADKLAINIADGEPWQPGKLIAFILLLICYVLWFWIPMALVYASSRIILRSLPERKRKDAATSNGG